jgi:hypothetical protein
MKSQERARLRKLVKDRGLREVAKVAGVDHVTLLRLLSDDVVPTSPGSQAMILSYLRTA